MFEEFTSEEGAVLRGLARHILEMLSKAEKQAYEGGLSAGDSNEFQRGRHEGYKVGYEAGHSMAKLEKQAVSTCVHGVQLIDPCFNCSGEGHFVK